MTTPPLVSEHPELTAEEVRRYSRHLTIPEIGLPGQKRLKGSRVLCVGAGGLGSPALIYLAAAGVGTLGVIDFDVVDESNLQRQIIHQTSDVNRLKVDSAAETIHGINPRVDVITHNDTLESGNALDLFKGYDLIVDGTDNFATRYLVNDAAVLTGRPYVWGSIYRFDGQASVFGAQDGPCYRCLHPEPPPPGSVPNCAEGGVLGVLCATIASIQVTEAVKLLTGIGEPLIGRLMTYDALDMSFRTVGFSRDPNCALCGKEPTVTALVDYDTFCGATASQPNLDASVTSHELHAKQVSGNEFLLIDVREQTEFDIVRIPASTLIPKSEFVSGAALSRLPRDAEIILYCKSGVRSAEVLSMLDAAGFTNAKHLQGGVLSWIKTIDPSLPTY